MARQILPTVWFAADVDALKKEVLENITATDLGVQACAQLTDLMRAQWGLFFSAAREWANTGSSMWDAAADANRGQGYQDELYTWQQQLNATGCAVPLYNPQPADAPGTSAVKWLTIGVVAVAGAYVVGKVTQVAIEGLELVPKRAR